jgi:hypothetical protein
VTSINRLRQPLFCLHFCGDPDYGAKHGYEKKEEEEIIKEEVRLHAPTGTTRPGAMLEDRPSTLRTQHCRAADIQAKLEQDEMMGVAGVLLREKRGRRKRCMVLTTSQRAT